MPANAGKPWTEQEDRELLEKFDAGQSLAQLAEAHDRTPAGIHARLERQKDGVSFIYREEALGKGKSGRPTIVPVILRDPSSSHE